VLGDDDETADCGLDTQGEKCGCGESGIVDAKRTHCSRSMVDKCSGSKDGERGKREPGIDIDNLRFSARGKGGGDGERPAKL